MARSLNVLFCVTSSSWGGNEKWALEAARSLVARGHRATVIASHPSVLREVEARGLPARRVRLRGDLDVVGVASLAHAVAAERPDALVLTKQREYWLGGLAARLHAPSGMHGSRSGRAGAGAPRARRPLVVLRLGLRRELPNDLKRRLAFGRLADLIVVNSLSVAGALRASAWLDQSKVRVVLNGVDVAPVDRGAGARALAALGVPAGVPVVCSVGRLTRQKGFDILIRALPLVLREVSDLRAVIVGEGGKRAELEADAAREGVAGAVVFAGHRDGVRELLSGATAYVLSSRNEGMANTLLEAMSVGAPIVAADVAGTREAVRDRVEALVVPPEDPPALANALIALLRDPKLARRLGEAALARARSQFTYERMARDLENALLEALG